MSKRRNAASRGSLTVGRAVQLYLAEQFRELKRIAPGLDSPDAAIAAEAVHDLRVTCQQMRSVLKAFETYLPQAAADRLARRIRRLQRAFGDVRDLEVLLGQPQLTPDLRRPFEARLAEAMQSLLAQNGSRKICRQAKRMRRCLREPEMEIKLNPEPLDARGVVQVRRLDAVIPAVLYSQAAAVTAYRPFIPDTLGPDIRIRTEDAGSDQLPRFWEAPAWPSGTVLHRLRLAFKQFRHLLMMLCLLWGEQGDDLIADLKHMQDRLGRLHDREVLLETLHSHCRSQDGQAGQPGQPADDPCQNASPAEAAAVRAVWPQLEQLQASEFQEFLTAWQPMDMAWFHRQLQPLIAWSIEQAVRVDGPLAEEPPEAGKPTAKMAATAKRAKPTASKSSRTASSPAPRQRPAAGRSSGNKKAAARPKEGS